MARQGRSCRTAPPMRGIAAGLNDTRCRGSPRCLTDKVLGGGHGPEVRERFGLLPGGMLTTRRRGGG
ncbi:hypothetical protein SCAB_62692 [Streptomyces scabiei 87.22]|uniref:Uncharacterized protein n=1 Tax=Streptomyces scabiei (strain 87.22) TaxID=680198 RepID=C9ZC86_STRSW|nr:hypothetical protein SCAB_62692 [Streptomyces scabiei 87.22]